MMPGRPGRIAVETLSSPAWFFRLPPGQPLGRFQDRGRCFSVHQVSDQGVEGGGAEDEHSSHGQGIEGSGDEGFHKFGEWLVAVWMEITAFLERCKEYL